MSSNGYLVSVVIPMYNSECSIEKALASITNQTCKVFEIIVVDDGSTDRSSYLVEKFSQSHPEFRIKLLKKLNGGVSSARNIGMMESQGNFIAFLDSDDEWLPHKTQVQIDILKKDASLAFIAGTTFYPIESMRGRLRVVTLNDLIFKNYFQPSTVIMRRKVYEEVGSFNESQRFAEEGNYFMRVAHKFKCALLYEKLIIYGNGKEGFGSSGLSANLCEMEKGELLNLKFAYTNSYISFAKYSIAGLFSLAKFVRRVIIVKVRRV